MLIVRFQLYGSALGVFINSLLFQLLQSFTKKIKLIGHYNF